MRRCNIMSSDQKEEFCLRPPIYPPPHHIWNCGYCDILLWPDVMWGWDMYSTPLHALGYVAYPESRCTGLGAPPPPVAVSQHSRDPQGPLQTRTTRFRGIRDTPTAERGTFYAHMHARMTGICRLRCVINPGYVAYAW